MAKPGYGKRSAGDSPSPADFTHLPVREAYLAAFIDQLPEGAAMDVKTLAKAQPLCLTVKPTSDGAHSEIATWFQESCLRQKPNLSPYTYAGFRSAHDRRDRVRPDVALAPDSYLAGQGQWADPEGVLLVMEVACRAPGVDRRDWRHKRDGYAAVGVPFHLVVDRQTRTVTVYSEPGEGTYRSRWAYPYGALVEIADPVGITLDTEKLKDYVH